MWTISSTALFAVQVLREGERRSRTGPSSPCGCSFLSHRLGLSALSAVWSRNFFSSIMLIKSIAAGTSLPADDLIVILHEY